MKLCFEICSGVPLFVQLVRIFRAFKRYGKNFSPVSDLSKPLLNAVNERASSCISFAHDKYFRDLGEILRLETLRHLRPGNADRGKAIVPQCPTIRFALHKDKTTGVLRLRKPIKPVRNN